MTSQEHKTDLPDDEAQTTNVPYLTRLVLKHFPPMPISYGQASPAIIYNRPRGLRRVLYKVFPPPPQTNVPWYSSSVSSKLKVSYDFYASYTGLEGSALEQHIENIRARAWKVVPYPCFGRGWFLLPGLAGLDIWEHVVKAGKEGKRILDMGCGLGQNIRRLRNEIGTAGDLYATDPKKEFWELGCELFDDRTESPAKFLCAESQYPSKHGGLLDSLNGSVDVIFTSGLLDLFPRQSQLLLGGTMVELSKVGTKVVGCALGTVHEHGGDHHSRPGEVSRAYHDACHANCNHSLHNGRCYQGSFHTLWVDICSQTRSSWKVEAQCVELSEWGYDESDITWMTRPFVPMGLQFVLTREA
jgi:hypothetical protein